MPKANQPPVLHLRLNLHAAVKSLLLVDDHIWACTAPAVVIWNAKTLEVVGEIDTRTTHKDLVRHLLLADTATIWGASLDEELPLCIWELRQRSSFSAVNHNDVANNNTNANHNNRYNGIDKITDTKEAEQGRIRRPRFGSHPELSQARGSCSSGFPPRRSHSQATVASSHDLVVCSSCSSPIGAPSSCARVQPIDMEQVATHTATYTTGEEKASNKRTKKTPRSGGRERGKKKASQESPRVKSARKTHNTAPTTMATAKTVIEQPAEPEEALRLLVRCPQIEEFGEDFMEVMLERRTIAELRRVVAEDFGVAAESIKRLRKLPDILLCRDKHVAALRADARLELLLHAGSPQSPMMSPSFPSLPSAFGSKDLLL